MLCCIWVGFFKPAKEHFLSRDFDFSVKPFGKAAGGGALCKPMSWWSFICTAWFMFAFHSFAMCWCKLVKLQGKIHRLSHLPANRAMEAQAKWRHIFLQWITTQTGATITDLFSAKGGAFFPDWLGFWSTRETAQVSQVSTQECLHHVMQPAAGIPELTANRLSAVQGHVDLPPLVQKPYPWVCTVLQSS